MKANELNLDLVQLAYKKLKASAYSDKTCAPLRDQIVEYEMVAFDESLKELYHSLAGSNQAWKIYQDKLLHTIDFLTLPKSYEEEANPSALIMNYGENSPELSKCQYYAVLEVPVHIIGVLWLLTIGKMIDDRTYPHSYGNRLHSKLMDNEGNVCKATRLFQPYYKQYGSWRDRALRLAESHMSDGEDVFILTLDFQSFFYSVDLNEGLYNRLVLEYLGNDSAKQSKKWIRRIHAFVWKVIEEYTKTLQSNEVVLEVQNQEDKKKQLSISQDIKHLLPIGFLPSNILSNWVLGDFDKAIINQWNPVYYGRYVDDIIILDKAPKDSAVYMKARQIGEYRNYNLNADDIITRYLICCSRESNNSTPCAGNILISRSNPESEGYTVNHSILNMVGSFLHIQKKKVRAFYFRHDASRSLINKFREDIANNASEFRVLPEIDEALDYENYSSVIEISRNDTINKLCGIERVGVDRFKLSKFLGKYSLVRSLVSEDIRENLELEMLKMLDASTILINYTLWDRILEILIIAERFDVYFETIKKISRAIKQITHRANHEKCAESLYKFLFAAIHRTSAIVWGSNINVTIADIASHVDIENTEHLRFMRKGYLRTRMITKTLAPILNDIVFETELKTLENGRFNLAKFDDCMKLLQAPMQKNQENEYGFYPFWISPSEKTYSQICENIAMNQPIGTDIEFVQYHNEDEQNRHTSADSISIVNAIPRKDNQEIVFLPTNKLPLIKVAIGNATVPEANYENSLKQKSTKTVLRYKQFAHIVDAAIRERCDLLVLPELYTPLEWIPTLMRKCAKVQMAVVTGVDVVIGGSSTNQKGSVYNLTATILPYEVEGVKNAYVSYHHKVHYSPEEKAIIERYGYVVKQGEKYHLYGWHGIWFSVYCCFELACIEDRALFNSLGDITIGVELNRDTPYYENLSNSLSRDLHCYVIQANTAEFGGSGVIQPKKSVESRVIWTKGGDNFTILTTTINVQALRESQLPVQGDRKPFKPLPPISKREYIEARYNGTLWEQLQKEGPKKELGFL